MTRFVTLFSIIVGIGIGSAIACSNLLPTSRNYLQGVYANPTEISTPNLMKYAWDYTINDGAQDNLLGGNVHGLYAPTFPGYPIIIDLFHLNTTYSDAVAASSTDPTSTYNVGYAKTATSISAYSNIYAIRIDSEFNGAWSPWSPWFTSTTITPTVYIAGWRNLALAVRAKIPSALIIWNPALGQNDPTTYYPGDDVVDLIGPDVYFQPKYFPTSAAAWTDALSGSAGGFNLTSLSAFAVTHNKPMIVPEWGDSFDDGYAIDKMRDWMDHNNVVAHSYWDSGDALAKTAALPPQPNDQAAYVANFGSRAYKGTFWPSILTVPTNTAVWP